MLPAAEDDFTTEKFVKIFPAAAISDPSHPEDVIVYMRTQTHEDLIANGRLPEYFNMMHWLLTTQNWAGSSG
jgi:hypothetical protein